MSVRTDAKSIVNLAVQQIMGVPPEKSITTLSFTWNADGTLATLKAYYSAELLFTLTFTWNPDGTLQGVSRS
jgi:hypothetical protein